MIERRIASNGVVYYASPLLERLGVPHGFSTRLGGKSPPPFDSLNLGNPTGCERQDDYQRIYENFDLFQHAVGVGGRQRCWVHQVHGGDVISVRRGEPFENGPRADALVCDDPKRVMSVRVADCVPVLLASADRRVVAAVHAGWRGVVAGVVANAVEALNSLSPVRRGEGWGEGRAARGGEQPFTRVHAHPTPLPRPLPGVAGRGSELVAAIGPSIGFDAFEVGPEVLEQFEQAFGGDAPIRRRDDGKGYADLRAAIRLQLLRLGVGDDRIDATDRCTFRDAEEFFSHRRERGVTGRMAAIISPVGE
jgi:copper oxidase (laccase) domain-containing protein